MAWKRPKSLVKSKCNWYRVLSGRFFFSPDTISKGDDIKIKRKSVLFSFFWTFILFSLPSFLYFLPVYMAWKRPKSLVKSKCNWYLVLNRRFFFLPDTISKGDDIKIKRKSVLFSFFCAFIFFSLPSFFYFLPVYMAWKRPKSLVKSKCNWYRVLSGRFFSRQTLSPKVTI